MHDTGDLVTTAGAAKIHGTVPDNIRRLARTGRLPFITVDAGGRTQRLFRRADVEALRALREGPR